MRISKNSAMEIVSEISNITGANINIMNEAGFIIASTDEKRIGQYHLIAKKVIDENLSEYFVEENINNTNIKRGLNLPIVYKHEIIGVIGITGEYDQVAKLSQIVKKMTEILIVGQMRTKEQELEEMAKNRFIYSWLYGKNDEQNDNMINLGLSLGVDITIKRRVLIISLHTSFNTIKNSTYSLDKCEKRIQAEILKNKRNVFFKSGNMLICLLDIKTDESLYLFIERIENIVKNENELFYKIGVDLYLEENNIQKSFLYAQKAYNGCIESDAVKFYEEIIMELFSNEVSKEAKLEYLNKIFKNMNAKELRMNIELLEKYFEYDGKINLIAQEIFMHKNTLQYRLKRLYEITSYDVRTPKGSAIFYIAIRFFRDFEGYVTTF